MWTRGKKRERQIALGIGIALTAGMIGAPTAFAAPVLDTSKGNGGIVSGGATVNQNPMNPADTTITSNAQNNVIAWQDFSVNKGESVTFDNGMTSGTGAHNYMNIVTGANTSDIAGTISGGDHVYLINPNGVIFHEGSSVNVGNLSVSTRYVDPNEVKAQVEAAGASSDVLVNVLGTSVSSLGADVVNVGAGTVTANSVFVEGNHVRFLNADQVHVAPANVTVRAGGSFHVGTLSGKDAGYTAANLTDLAKNPLASASYVTYKVIKPTDWNKEIQDNPAGNYMLSGDIDDQHQGHLTDVEKTFTGKIDGAGFRIVNADLDRALFHATSGAVIENLGLANSTVAGNGVSAGNGGGAFVGNATNTTLRRVYSTGNTVGGADSFYTGGLVGITDGAVTIENSYNGSSVNGAGLVGYVSSGTTSITNAYASGTVTEAAVAAYKSGGSTLALLNVVANGQEFLPGLDASSSVKNSITYQNGSIVGYAGADGHVTKPNEATDAKKIQQYVNLAGWTQATDAAPTGVIGLTGGVLHDATGKTDNTYRPAWRIYEGMSMPVLTALTKGVKSVSYDYQYYGKYDSKTNSRDYKAADTSVNDNIYNKQTDRTYTYGTNKGKDLTALPDGSTSLSDGLVYNGDYLKIINADGTAVDGSTINTTDAVRLADGTTLTNLQYKMSADGNYGQKNATDSIALIAPTNPQFGYDLVGANIAIAKRQVNADVKLDNNTTIIKEYDGTNDASGAVEKVIKGLVVGAPTGSTGIIEGDGATVKFTPNGNTVFGSKDVHARTDGDVTIDGELSIDGAGDNYKLSGVTNGVSTPIHGTAAGAIYQKAITINMNPGQFSKTYDGTRTVKSGKDEVDILEKDTQGTGYKYFTLDGVVNKETVVLDSGASLSYDTKNAGNGKTITISGVKLGRGSSNYKLVDSSGNLVYTEKQLIDSTTGLADTVTPFNTPGAFTTTGNILKRQLTKAGFTAYKADGSKVSAVKTYDGTSDYDGADGLVVRSKDILTFEKDGKTQWDGVTFTVTADASGKTAHFTKSQTDTTETKDAGTGYGVAYHVTVTGTDADGDGVNDASNYYIDSTSDDLTKSFTTDVTGGGGQINRRLIKVAPGENYDKFYDGTADVANAAFGKHVVYDPAYTKEYQLVETDGSSITIDSRQSQYAAMGATDGNVAANVNYDAAQDKVLSKTINYALSIDKGNNNYTFSADTIDPSKTATSTYTVQGTGVINPEVLTNISFWDLEKTYDTYDTVQNNQEKDKLTYALEKGSATATHSGKTINGLTKIFDATKMKGYYGTGTGAADFVKSADVARDTDGNVTSKNVLYVGKGANGADASLSSALISSNHNYVLADDLTDVVGKGTINPLLIKSVTLTQDTITKTYDGTNTLKDAGSFLKSLTVDIPDGAGGTAATVDLFGKIDKTSGVSATFADENVHSTPLDPKPQMQAVTYLINFDPKTMGTNNYSLDSSISENGKLKYVFDPKALTSTANSAYGGGTITRKTITATPVKDLITKVYDGTDVVKDGDTALSGSGAVTLNDLADKDTKISGLNTSTAAYRSLTGKRAKDAENGKAVDYTIGFSDKYKTIANNYTVITADGKKTILFDQGSSQNALVGTGDITKAPLTFDLPGMTKIYDGTTALSDDNIKAIEDAVLPKGLKTDKDEVVIDKETLKKAQYAGADVGDKKNIVYDIVLKGADKDNYTLTGSNGTYDSEKNTFTTTNNAIRTAELKKGDIEISFRDITKAYDGKTDVAYDHTRWNKDLGQNGSKNIDDFISGFTFGKDTLVREGKKTGAGYFSATGVYNDATVAGANDADFTFTLSENLVKNYDLKYFIDAGYYNKDTRTLNWHNVATNDFYGDNKAKVVSITPQNVLATLDTKAISKLYDGTNLYKNVFDGANNQVSPESMILFIATTKDFEKSLASNVTATLGDDLKGNVRKNSAGYADQTASYKVTVNPNFQIYQDSVSSSNNALGSTGITLTGKGKILPRTITGFTLGDVTKGYDAKTGVGTNGTTLAEAIRNGTVTGTITGEDLSYVLDARKLTGDYSEEGTPSANVRRDVNGSVIAKDVSYKAASGGTLAGALKENGTGGGATNYILATDIDTAEYLKTNGGTITPLSLSLDKLAATYAKDITKVYDGSAKLTYDHSGWKYGQEGEADAADYLGTLTLTDGVTGTGGTLDLLAGDHTTTGTYQKSGTDTAEVGAPDSARFQLAFSGDGARSLDNYTFTSGTNGVTYDRANHTLTLLANTASKKADGSNLGISITPQTVVATFDSPVVKHTYDDTRNLTEVTSYLKLNTASGGELGAPGIKHAEIGDADNPHGEVKVDASGNVAAQTTSYTINLGSKNYQLYKDAATGTVTVGDQDLSFTGTGYITPRAVDIGFGTVDKEYEGMSNVLQPSGIQTALTGATVTGTIGGAGFADVFDTSKLSTTLVANYGDLAEDGTFAASANVRRDPAGNVIAKDVGYDLTALTDAIKTNGFGGRNYAMNTKDKSAYIKKDGGTITAKQATLTDLLKVSYAKDITKVYDGNTNVTYDHRGWIRQQESADAGDYLGTVSIKDGLGTEHSAQEGSGFAIQDAQYKSAQVGAGNAATFHLVLSGDAKENFDNYDFTQDAANRYDAATHTLTLTATDGMKDAANKTIAVSITPQQAVARATGGVTRDYDGTTALYGTRTDAGHVGEQVKSLANLVTIQRSDGTFLTHATISGSFADKNVVTTGMPGVYGTTDLRYTISLGTKNYDLYADSVAGSGVAGTGSLSLTGKDLGKITPYTITNIDFGFQEAAAADYNSRTGDTVANKAYDGSAEVKDIRATFTGKNGERMTLDDARAFGLIGTYGSAASGTFVADANVNLIDGTSEAERTGYKAVQYSNLAAAMAAKGKDGSFDASNYTIADTVLFTEEAKKGKIRRLALTGGDVVAKWTGAPTKVYDATASLSAETAKGVFYLVTNKDTVGASNTIDYDVNEANSFYGTVAAPRKDVGTGLDAQIAISGINTVSLEPNFVMKEEDLSDILTEALKNAGLGGSDHVVKTKSASITPRRITYHLAHTTNKDAGLDPNTLSKIYDGTDNADDFHSNLVIDDDVKNILDQDTDVKNGTVTLDWTQKYADKNATSTQGKATGKAAIDYTLTLTGNDKGNYTFDVQRTGHGKTGDAKETAKATAYGDIWKRKVYYDFQGGGQATDIDREYNGAADVSVPDSYKDLVVLQGKTETTGIVDGTGIDRTALNVSYDAGGVIREADGSVRENAHQVTFKNIGLTGADAANYELLPAAGASYAKGGTLTGTGTITPKAVRLRTDGTNVKVYDGTTTVYAGDGVDAAHRGNTGRPEVTDLSGAGLGYDASALVAGDTLGLKLKGAAYTSANAGTDTIRYDLAWDNGNYEVEAEDPDDWVKNGLTGLFTATNGNITRRAVQLTAADAEKDYDGTTNLQNAASYLSADNLVKGQTTAGLGLSATGTFSSADAADSEAEDETERTITYGGLSLENSNYEIASSPVTGRGKIHRLSLTATADKSSAYVGDALPKFTGSVTGFIGADEASDFTFLLDYDGTPQQPGSYGVYGWYGGRSDGNFGRNYTFSQDPANETAFELKVLDPGHEYHDAIESNRVIPDDTVYHQASGDYTEAFIRDPKYAIEYAAGGVGSGAESVSQGAGRQGSALVTTAAEEARNASGASAPAGGTGAGRTADALVTTAEKDAAAGTAGSGATGTAGAIGAAGNGTTGTVAGGASLYGGGQAALFGSGGSSMPQYFGYGPTGSMMGASSLLGAYGSMTLAQSGMESLSSLVSGAGTGSLTGADLSTAATSGAPSPYGLDAALGLFAGGSSPQYFALGASSTAGAAGTSSGLTGADGQASGGAPATVADTAASTGADASAAEGQTASRLARIGLDGQDAVNLTDGDAMDGEEVLTMVEKKQAKDA